MTEQSIEELRRQFEQAKSKAIEAACAEELAKKRLRDAMCRRSGLMGKVAQTSRGQRILIHDVDFMRERPWKVRGFVLKADGTPGMREGIAYLDNASISDYEASR